MGIISRLRKRIFRSQSKVKDGITFASTSSSSFSLSKEPTTPHHGPIFATSVHSEQQHPQEFFASDFERAMYDDEESVMMESMILLHTSHCSSISVTELGEYHDDETASSFQDDFLNPRHSYDQLEIQTIMEPSFEVALMESIAPESCLENGQQPHPKDYESEHSCRAMSAEEVMMDLNNDLPVTGLLQPRKLYDHDGQAFLHIYTEGLSTLHESPSPVADLTPRAPRSKMMSIQMSISDDQKIQARWELARKQLVQEKDEYEVPSPSSPSYSRRTRRWFNAIALP
jgi:hypothetical protein